MSRNHQQQQQQQQQYYDKDVEYSRRESVQVFLFKGTVSVISSDPPYKYDNIQFTTLPLKVWMSYLWFCFFKLFIFICSFSAKVTCAICWNKLQLIWFDYLFLLLLLLSSLFLLLLLLLLFWSLILLLIMTLSMLLLMSLLSLLSLSWL